MAGRRPGWKANRLISRRAFLIGSIAPFLLRVPAATAQGSCGAEEEIVALADYVLANRSKLPKLQNRRNGAISAYLKIHYRGMADDQVKAMLEPLQAARIDRAAEIQLTWRISRDGLEQMLANTPDRERELLSAAQGVSPIRAAVRSGEIAPLFDRVAALASEADRFRFEIAAVETLIDMDDGSRITLAEEAVKRKLFTLAGGLAATSGDPAAWPAFLAMLADAKKGEELAERLHWMPALRGNPPLPRKPASDTQGEIRRSLLHQATIAAARTPERDYLITYLNQSGDFAGTSAAASMLNDLTRDGAAIDMETAWLVVYEALKEASAAKDAVDTQLASIRLSGTRFGGASVREAIDTMLAVEAFKSAASGSGAAPDMVEGASRELVVQLPAWREAAEAIGKNGDLAPFRSSGQKLAIAAHLLFATGRHQELSAFLTRTVPNADSIRLAEIYAEALDRRCGGHLAFPGEAVTMPGLPLFRFEPAR